MVVRRSTLPGGYRVVQQQLTEEQARARAAKYSRPHEAMSHKDLIGRRIEALEEFASVPPSVPAVDVDPGASS
jgi:hypothetical protein